MSSLFYDVFPTQLGWVGALASETGLRRLALRPTPNEALESLGPDLNSATQDPDTLANLRGQVEAYADGDQGAMDSVPLDLGDAPPFFRAAWEACRTIPRGETRSYAWLAAEAGNPRAVRAAGQAMARNPLILVVPCHRVIGSNGGLHGYGGGLEKKAALLERERR